MNKATTLTLLLCLLICPSKAQNAADTASTPAATRQHHWSVGVTAGSDRNYHQVDMSYMKDIKYDKYTQGNTFGLHVQYNPVKWLGLRLDGVWIQKNYHMDHVSMIDNTRYATTYTTTDNNYINVPLTVDLSFGRLVRIHLTGGGYVGYWMTSHRTGSSFSMTHMMYGDESTDTFDEDVPFNDTRDQRLDAGLTFGAGVGTNVLGLLGGEALQRLTLEFEIRWYYGMLDIQKDYMRNLNPRYNTTLAFQGGISYTL